VGVLQRENCWSGDGWVLETGEEIAGAFAGGAFFVAEVAGGLALLAFDPVRRLEGGGVGAIAALQRDGFAASGVGDPGVVTHSAACCATGDRQVSLHVLMIRRCDAFTYSVSDSRRVLFVGRVA
jgi:hypothetical protein